MNLKYFNIKKCMFLLMAGACVNVSLTACGSDDDNTSEYFISDCSPIIYRVLLEGANGQDLLDSNVEGNLREAVSVVCNDSVFYPDSSDVFTVEEIKNHMTRYYFPDPLRLRIRKGDGLRKNRYMLSFGEFDRALSHEWQEVTLQIGKAKQIKLAFHNETATQGDGTPILECDFYYNDTKCTFESSGDEYYRLRVSDDTKTVELLPPGDY